MIRQPCMSLGKTQLQTAIDMLVIIIRHKPTAASNSACSLLRLMSGTVVYCTSLEGLTNKPHQRMAASAVTQLD